MTNFTTPVGRIVAGNLYVPNTKNAEGKPLTDKSGNPRNEFFFAVAIPKAGEAHWKDTEWGAVIWAEGVKGDQYAPTRPTFSWKVEDGDSQIPNQKGKKPCDREGYRGHWVLRFTGGYAPKLYSTVNSTQPVEIVEEGAIRPGYYVQVAAGVKFNGSAQQPGVYLNHSMVCLRAYGTPIVASGPDVAAAGFGAAPLPAGATMVPAAGPMPPAAAVMPPAAAVMPPAAAVMPPAPPLPVPPPAPAFRQVRQMTEKAGGATYEAMIAAGWSDGLLIQHGMMTA